MNKIAIIGGSILKNFQKNNVVFLQRHEGNTPPHKINHKKNIMTLKKQGVGLIIGVNSVGSLKIKIHPGSIVVPDDYINLFQVQTIFNTRKEHIVPSIDNDLRNKIIKASKKLNLEVHQKGIYFQTIGPRFETVAEINMIKKFADIVGMTMGSEATIANEMGIRYASICSVDNYANGISSKQITTKEWEDGIEKNLKNIKKLIGSLI